ncbi:uncharacterized protein N7479_005077 [Penicillium vulpinum]|uniref:uncharacterized protein n=1 Tax=Penicillium vulpinum TaxID=29845 RepID=UPI0025481D55|nr:uncharacterized protein N7479_005077 [Penicillium vulpinum]KAJ5965201.1 hypothetical protein N7479_005077 [Penicillium vulpinum]
MLTFSHLDADAFENPKKNNGRKRPRFREPVACNHCRKSKVRCNRKSPCKPCQDRGKATQCAYSRPRSPAGSEFARPLVSRVSSRSKEIDLLALQQPAPHSPDGEIHDPQSPHNQSTASHANSAFKGSDFKTRLIGGTHWMAVCNNLPVIGAMLEKTVDFQPTWRIFAEVKSLLRVANSVPAVMNGDHKTLLNLLPDRLTCEKWIRRFCETYGKIYHVIDQNCLMTELEEISIACVNANEVHVLKILLVIAIAMQTDKLERLHGRLILKEAESRIHTSTRFQKPCIGVVQALLLLIIMKTITVSDSDKIHSLMGIMGLTTQIVLSMGLHRDPALFSGVTPYYAEVRKRLWACFFRLNLDYCISSGSHFGIRLEDVDCPLPTPIDLLTLDPGTMEPATSLNQAQEATEQAFNIAAMKLAIMRAPLHQRLCSATPQLSSEVRDRMRASFHKILRELPPNLQEGASSCSPIEKLQQALLSVHVHSFMIIITLNFVLGVPFPNSQRGDLYEAWDNSVSILYKLQEGLQSGSELSSVAYHLLWTDLARAALTACLVVVRLRNITLGTTVCNAPPPTLVMFQQLLLKYLDSLSQILAGRYRLGPVVAKTRLVLAVAITFTSSLINDFHSSQQDFKFFQVGITAAEEIVTEMERSLKREYQDSMFALLGFNTIRTSAPPNATNIIAANWMDHAQLPDPLIHTLFPSDCDLYPGLESPSLDMQSDLCLPYSMAPFESTSTILSTSNILWEGV